MTSSKEFPLKKNIKYILLARLSSPIFISQDCNVPIQTVGKVTISGEVLLFYYSWAAKVARDQRIVIISKCY